MRTYRRTNILLYSKYPFPQYQDERTVSKHKVQQESIPVGCVPPTYQPYVLWWPPIGVSTGGGEYPRTYVQWGGVGIPWDLGYPPLYIHTSPPGHAHSLDTPTPWTRPPPGHAHSLLVTHGGHHWRHTHPLSPNRMTGACENITFPQLR